MNIPPSAILELIAENASKDEEIARLREAFASGHSALLLAKEIIDDQARRFHKDCRCQLCESCPQVIADALAKLEGSNR